MMDQTIWNFIFIGITFGVYAGIATTRAGSTKEYYTASGGVSPLPTVWQLRRIGCPRYLHPWPEALPPPAMGHPSFSWVGPGFVLLTT